MCIAEFSIWTREAGAGGLSIAVEGPSKAEIAFEDRKDGSSGVSYIVQEPGERRNGQIFANVFFFLFFSSPLLFITVHELWSLACFVFSVTFWLKLFPPVGDYEVSIRFNDEHIPDSPFIVPVASPSDDARRLTVASLQVRLWDTHTRPCAHTPGQSAPFTMQQQQQIETLVCARSDWRSPALDWISCTIQCKTVSKMFYFKKSF